MATEPAFGYRVVARACQLSNVPLRVFGRLPARRMMKRTARVPLFRIRPTVVEAMRFGGSPASTVEVIAWTRSVAPKIMVRERIEYGGWHDPDGHIELEIQGNDVQASNGDWIICNGSAGNRWFEVVSDTAFRQRFEPHPDHIPA